MEHQAYTTYNSSAIFRGPRPTTNKFTPRGGYSGNSYHPSRSFRRFDEESNFAHAPRRDLPRRDFYEERYPQYHQQPRRAQQAPKTFTEDPRQLKPYYEVENSNQEMPQKLQAKKAESQSRPATAKENLQKRTPAKKEARPKKPLSEKPQEKGAPKEKTVHPLDEVRVGRFKKFSFYMYLAKKILHGGSSVVKLLGSGDFNIMAVMRLSDLLTESGYATITSLKPNTFKREGKTICSCMIVLTKSDTFHEKYDEFEVKRKERAAKKSAESKEGESPRNQEASEGHAQIEEEENRAPLSSSQQQEIAA